MKKYHNMLIYYNLLLIIIYKLWLLIIKTIMAYFFKEFFIFKFVFIVFENK